MEEPTTSRHQTLGNKVTKSLEWQKPITSLQLNKWLIWAADTTLRILPPFQAIVSEDLNANSIKLEEKEE